MSRKVSWENNIQQETDAISQLEKQVTSNCFFTHYILSLLQLTLLLLALQSYTSFIEEDSCDKNVHTSTNSVSGQVSLYFSQVYWFTPTLLKFNRPPAFVNQKRERKKKKNWKALFIIAFFICTYDSIWAIPFFLHSFYISLLLIFFGNFFLKSNALSLTSSA